MSSCELILNYEMIIVQALCVKLYASFDIDLHFVCYAACVVLGDTIPSVRVLWRMDPGAFVLQQCQLSGK